MLSKIIFLKEFRKVFQPGDVVEFRPGINLIVGEQGTGKSSLYKMLVDFTMGGDLKSKYAKQDAAKICEVVPLTNCRISAFDHEKMNPRTLSYFGDNAAFQVGAMFSSHGESVNAINYAFATCKDTTPHVFIMDEPDAALSIRSVWGLLSALFECVKNGHQIIIIVHNPILIASQEEVYDMGQKKWIKSKDFIASMTPKEGEPLPRPWENMPKLEKKVQTVYTGSNSKRPSEKKIKDQDNKQVDKIAPL